MQTSRGKYDRFPHTTAGSTLGVLDGYGLCSRRAARPSPHASIRFLSIGSCFCSALPSDPISRRAPLRSATLHLHQVGGRLSLPSCRTVLGTPLLLRPFRAPSPAHPKVFVIQTHIRFSTSPGQQSSFESHRHRRFTLNRISKNTSRDARTSGTCMPLFESLNC
jgi:hypothetical protein